MKRSGNCFPRIVSLDTLRLAHERARRNKTHYADVRRVDARLEKHLRKLRKDLATGRFTTSAYTTVTRMEGGKLRTIHKLPYYPDRIVHHAIMLVCGERWEGSLIRDTFQSLKGRGTSDARKRVQLGIREDQPTHYLKMDVQQFYPSIPHRVLKAVVRKRVKCTRTLSLLYNIIDSIKGLPIGNYLSQILGNLVLSSVDWWAKQVAKARRYYRYCDDIVVLGSSPQWLHWFRTEFTKRVSELGLTIKDTWVVGSLKTGLDFCGYVFTQNKLYLRARIVDAFRAAIARHDKKSITAYWGWIKPLNDNGLWHEAPKTLRCV